ncbi:right-handed parallel beta-helix repeat-containing protein [Bacteroidota bacterium]
MKRLVSILIAVILVLGMGSVVISPHTALAASINVPGDYATIQEAINAAAPGDTINVAAGTYQENLTWYSKHLVIQGAGADVTTIDGGGSNRVISTNGLSTSAKLEGFTITNGGGYDGGAMYNNHSSPTITNCIFSNNTVSSRGGAMYNVQSSPIVTNCIFSNNRSENAAGAMFNYQSSPTVTNCTFNENSARSSGGAMNNEYQCSPTVTNCTFSNNRVDSGGYGGAMFNVESTPAVTSCIFSGNSARYGGGMYNHGCPSSLRVINCIFSGNSASYGGGMYNRWKSYTRVINCTFTGNYASSQGGAMYSVSYAEPKVYNSILWDNSPNEVINYQSSRTTLTYCDVQGGYSGTGNIDADPLLNETFHILGGSPCIDAGVNNAAPPDDFDGQPRPFDGDGDGDAIADIGADEYVPPSIDEFSVIDMDIDFDERPNRDRIRIKEATFSLYIPDGMVNAPYDLSIDDVIVNIDGVVITIPAGSFDKDKKKDKYHFESTKGVEPKVDMKLDFDKGEWDLKVDKVDASVIDNCDGVVVTFSIGAMSAEDDIDMWVESLSYNKESQNTGGGDDDDSNESESEEESSD